MRALVITTSHGVLNAPGETDGDPTGVMASELTHPYYGFLDAGMQVDVASVRGGPIPVEPGSLGFVIRTPEDERFLEDPVLQAKVKNSLLLVDDDVGGEQVLECGCAVVDGARFPQLHCTENATNANHLRSRLLEGRS